MSRSEKFTFHALIVLSALMCLMALALWIHSYFGDDHIGNYSQKAMSNGQFVELRTGLFSSDGKLTWSNRNDSNSVVTISSQHRIPPDNHFGFYSSTHGAFEYWYNERDESFICGFGSNYRIAAVPHLFAAGIFGVLPLWWATVYCQKWSARNGILFKTYAALIVTAWIGTSSLYFALIPIILGIFLFTFLIFAVLWISRIHSDYETKRDGLCRVCGYDLRATPNRCPECGTIPPNHPATDGTIK